MSLKELRMLSDDKQKYINMALSDKKLQISKFEKKYRKYKKLFKVTLGITVVLFVILCGFILAQIKF